MMETRTKTTNAIAKFYDPNKKRTISIPIRLLTELKPKIIQISLGKNCTTLKMAPEWFQYDDQDEALKNIVYPKGVTENEQRTFDTVARYRAATENPKNNFCQTPLDIGEQGTETLVVALGDFAQRYGGELTFTNEDIPFIEPAHRTACGIADFSSAHLLATDYIPTAKFTFLVDLDYQTDLARSGELMQNFVLEFSNAIARVLDCPNDYVRVISVEKPSKFRRQTKVNFGLTTPNSEETEQLAKDLKIKARDGFPKHRILKYVKANEYECKWKPLITFFQLQSTDFNPNFNVDYRTMRVTEEKRGGLPYYLPIGWYRHALKVIDKYPDDKLWLGKINGPGEWAVAFHGTKGHAVKGITEKGLLITKVDAMRTDAIQKKGKDFDKPGLYVATHCNGGAHPSYTDPFPIQSSSDKIDNFRVVFQCRVRPDAFTAHKSPVTKGEAWRFVDPYAIRPYGILVKNEKISDPNNDYANED